MAIQAIQQKIDALFTKVYTTKASNKAIRKKMGAGDLDCTVNVDHLANTLFKASEVQGVKRSDFKEYATFVKKEFALIPESMDENGRGIVKKVTSAKQVTFTVTGFKRNDMKFLRLNKKIQNKALVKFAKIFKSTNPKDNVEIAHAKGFSIVEAKASIASGVGTETAEDLAAVDFKDPQLTTELGGMLKKLKDSTIDVQLGMNSQINVNRGEISLGQTYFAAVEAKYQNREDAKKQSQKGRELKALIENIQEELGKVLSKANPGAEKASRSLTETIGDSIVAGKQVQKALRRKGSKNLSKYKSKVKSVPKKTVRSKKDTITQTAASLMVGGLPKGLKAPANKEIGTKGIDEAFDMRNLLKVKNAINKRLPAEVRRNMGRPALINRSGRFSNSVMIDSVFPAAQTLLVKYNYRLNPYETFENKGRNKWPSGYNPKPLIAKSIRNLAMGMVDQKLTIRRT